MTDKEMLELAAKAAGICLEWPSLPDIYPRDLATHRPWNPLADDGDALRLAVKCVLLMDADAQCAMQQERYGDQIGDWCDGGPDNDECARMRRAIVRASAEIGRAMDRVSLACNRWRHE